MRWRDVKRKEHTKDALHVEEKRDYAGFWSRVMGFVTDLFIIGMPISLLMMGIFGRDELKSATAFDVISHNEAAITNAPDPYASIVQILTTMSIYVFMWHYTQQTPGKKMARTRVVDATTLQRASYFQLIIRFFAYFLSAITLFGFFIGLIRKDKRCLHDLVSHTAVVYES
ncbi:MAG: RDD family protein [Campylobacterota bacterium]|nr:RDD family protein [Campylobacterota bacterium]